MQNEILHCHTAMSRTGEAKVSTRGQMALPAQTRHRWNLDDGGVVGWVDLGDAVLLFPGGTEQVRQELLEGADWESAAAGFGDPELANQ